MGWQLRSRPMSQTVVTVVINQQQADMLDRLIAEGRHGTSYGEVIRSGFRRFCEEHREMVDRPPENGSAGRSDG
jgi:Arc/MetJ-type ribon-helix-helix transcriptional regulator